jgi:hypothetical protein
MSATCRGRISKQFSGHLAATQRGDAAAYSSALA